MKNIFAMISAAVFLAGTTVFGVPTLGYVETFDSNLGTGGDWNYEVVGDGSGYDLANGGNGTLQLTLPNTGTPAARMYAGTASSSGYFTGDYAALASSMALASSNLLVSFTLTSLDNFNNNSGSMQLYFVGGGNTYILNYDFAQPAPSSPVTYTAMLSSALLGAEGLWNNLDGGVFANDFADVTQFGLQLVGSADNDIHRYQLDNFQLLGQAVVPEPETVWMMLIVLASLGMTFRGRLADVAGQLKARIKA